MCAERSNNSQESRCSITDDWTYKNMKVVFMENKFLRIGILVGRGSDIFEFKYKPLDLDPLLRLAKGIINPLEDSNQFPNESGRFEDYYYGGWQEIVPNSPVFNYRGAMLGQHGEVSLKPWRHTVLKDSSDEVVIKVWTEVLRLPLLIEKTLTIKKDEACLYISEKLTNKGQTSLDIMWGHHIAFGLPFLNKGGTIKTNAKTFSAEKSIASPRRFKPDTEFQWPYGQNVNGEKDDAQLIPDCKAAPYSELCYLKGFDKKAFYIIKNQEGTLSFKVGWDGDLFESLWLWQERYAIQDYPWWGNCYAVALEPWTSDWTDNPENAIRNGEWLKIKAGEVLTTNVSAEIN